MKTLFVILAILATGSSYAQFLDDDPSTKITTRKNATGITRNIGCWGVNSNTPYKDWAAFVTAATSTDSDPFGKTKQ